MDSGEGSAVEVEHVFIGAGCNRIVNNVSWGPSGLVSFGAQNAVAVFSPENGQICTTLPGHQATVNCTQWVPSAKDSFRVRLEETPHYLLSGSADGVIILWEINANKRKWRQVLQGLEPHKKGVICFAEIMISQNVAVVASTSSDCTVLIWEIVFPSGTGGDCRMSRLQCLSVGPKPMVSLSLSELPKNKGHIILAMGGLGHKIHIYCGEKTGKFVQACELKGHTDWIRSLDFSSSPVFTDRDESSIFLVSSSQDRSIRIWKITLNVPSASLEGLHEKETLGLTSYIKGPVLVAGSSSYQVSLESLLIGHEDWVYSVEWQPPLPSSTARNECFQPLSILSASMDKTMMIWKPEKTTGIWVNVVTVGELSHCALGFYGGHWSPDGQSILAHGHGGSFHLWKNVGTSYENWQPQKVPSGHYSAVSDITWAKSGEFLLSVSQDQTARIFAPWNRMHSADEASWHEIARPQVHGHDINCVAVIQGKGNHRFVSGADEKVGRVFSAPLSFLKTLNHTESLKVSGFENLQEEIHVLGANMSALGLSQKPIYVDGSSEARRTTTDVSDSLEAIPDAVPRVYTEPPVEEELGWNTLWPETHKLYGHGNELFSLCCDNNGKLVASSCKAQTASVAEIWIWEVGSWKAVGRLQSHSLTVTQMEFSNDDSLLLSVSRDRQFSVFALETGQDEITHQLVARQEAHKRIIWACSWNPFCHEFATGSRDKTVKIWGVDGIASVKHLLTLPQFRSSVTAMSWLGRDRLCNKGLLAVGMENGLIELWNLFGGSSSIGYSGTSKYNASLATRFDPLFCHASIVNRLAWREPSGESRNEDSTAMQLASCGADHCVRLFEVRL